MSNRVVDVTIIGGGPVGLYGVYTAGFQGLSVRLFESLSQLGGQLTALYPEKYIYDIAGIEATKAKDLIESLKRQAFQYDAEVYLGEQVLDLLPVGGHYVLKTVSGEYPTKTVVISGGLGAFTPRIPDIVGLEEWEGRGLHYMVQDPLRFKDKRVLVVGGGDSAVDWALSLADVASEVTLVHRRGSFRAAADSVFRLEESLVSSKYYHELSRLEGEKHLSRAVIYDNRTQEETVVSVDEVVMALGFVPNLGPIANWDLTLEGKSLVVNSEMRTNLPGVFAAGDVAVYPGKVKLITVGFGEVATAVHNAYHYLHPEDRKPVGHSSNRQRA